MTAEALSGKLALVTGASSGIGTEFAYLLAKRGYDLAITARRSDRLEDLAQSIRSKYGVNVEVIVEDLGTIEGANNLASRLELISTPLACIVNNAGRGVTKPFLELPWKTHDEMFNLLMRAPILLLYLLLPRLMRAAEPRLINVGSFSSYMPAIPNTGLYIGAKSFIFRMTELIAAEHAHSGLRATCICPGVTDTEIFEKSGVDSTQIPGRMMSPREVVERAWAANTRGVVSCVPGTRNKFLTWLGRVLPEAWLQRKMAALHVAR